MDVLSVKGLYKKIGRQSILEDVTIEVKEQEIVGFLGPNGSGKSTTIKCICGLYHATAGVITVNGYDIVKSRKEALNTMGVSIEAPALYPQLTGREHLKMMGRWRKAGKDRVKEMEDYSGLKHHLDKAVQGYSMGMKMRLMLSLTLMARPKLLILDEPTNGLDPQAVFELREQMEEIRREGSSILFSSHQLNEVEKLSDRIILLKQGKKVFDGHLSEELQSTFRYGLKVPDAGKTLHILMEEGMKDCREGEGEVFFSVKGEEEFYKVLSLMHKNELPVYDITKHEMNLEDFYRKVYEGGHGIAGANKK